MGLDAIAVFPQYTLRTDRQTDRPTDGIGDKSVPTPAYALGITTRLITNIR